MTYYVSRNCVYIWLFLNQCSTLLEKSYIQPGEHEERLTILKRSESSIYNIHIISDLYLMYFL